MKKLVLGFLFLSSCTAGFLRKQLVPPDKPALTASASTRATAVDTPLVTVRDTVPRPGTAPGYGIGWSGYLPTGYGTGYGTGRDTNVPCSA